jgi:hypothetical protein
MSLIKCFYITCLSRFCSLRTGFVGSVRLTPNKSLQGTFDPQPIFAAAKTGIASNAPELRR